MAKPQYQESSASLDAKERAKKDFKPASQLQKGVDPALSEDGFIGVSSEYRNYADEKFAPLASEKGVEADLEGALLADDVDIKKGAPAEGESEAEPEPSGSSSGASGSTGSTPPAPPSSGSGTVPPS
jgi:hypothetical protein